MNRYHTRQIGECRTLLDGLNDSLTRGDQATRQVNKCVCLLEMRGFSRGFLERFADQKFTPALNNRPPVLYKYTHKVATGETFDLGLTAFKVIELKDLPNMDWGSDLGNLTDAFVELSLHDGVTKEIVPGTTPLRTRTVDDSLNPVFNQVIDCPRSECL